MIYIMVYTKLIGGQAMLTAKIFNNGRSQAVRLPKEFRFKGREVYIRKFENMVILIPKDNPWQPFLDGLRDFSDDYLTERKQPAIQTRDDL